MLTLIVRSDKINLTNFSKSIVIKIHLNMLIFNTTKHGYVKSRCSNSRPLKSTWHDGLTCKSLKEIS